GLVRLWDPATLRLRATFSEHGAGVLSVAFAPDSKTLASAGSDKTLRLWDVSRTEPSVRCVLRRNMKSTVTALAFSPDGKTLASCSWDSSLRLWDLTGAEIRERSQLTTGMPYGRFNALAYAPDGQTLATSCADDTVRLWDVGGPEPKARAKFYAHNTYEG